MYVSDSARHRSRDICPAISQIVKNWQLSRRFQILAVNHWYM